MEPTNTRTLNGINALINGKTPEELSKLIAIDYSQIELTVLSRLGEAKFSDIYGTKKEEVVELVGKDQALRLSLKFIKTFPGLYVNKLRKAKARYMLEALRQGVYEGGNHFITCYGYVFHFFYRGTVIYRWDAIKDEGLPIHAKGYENTASTYNQRKEIAKAIDNFKESVLQL